MKKHLIQFLAVSFCLLLLQSKATAQTNPVKDWKMKTYYMVILKTGPHRDQDSSAAKQIQDAHLANMGKMFDDKKLVLAGPFMDDSQLAGIFIFDVATQEEADKLAAADPAVKAGRLIYEVHPWYGPAALRF
jgi:uncharacterized protein